MFFLCLVNQYADFILLWYQLGKNFLVLDDTLRYSI